MDTNNNTRPDPTNAVFLAHPVHVDRNRRDDRCRLCADHGLTRVTWVEFTTEYPNWNRLTSEAEALARVTGATQVTVRRERRNEDGSLTVEDEGTWTRVVATGREETDPCEAGTPGCCIDHTADPGSCETW